MIHNQLQNIEQLESSLWEAADQLRANSKLTSGEYFMPVLGIIFLRHATNRYETARRQIAEDQAAGKMPKRPLVKQDFLKRRALMLPKEARFDELLKLPKGTNLGAALVEAMNVIERDFEPLLNQLPKDYDKFESNLLEEILRIFDTEVLRTASGDVFGRIYEYFLMKFAMQGAHDNGEFFTPPSLVQTIVNVIEPEHGIVFDPACGSGGMFVQSSHFIERLGADTAHRVTFFGQEKTATTIRLAKMNLAVHGLEGDIREANTFYEDVHTLYGKSDFVMANPPFNVDMVDAEKVKDDRRLPFGLPGVNKAKKVSNGNYLWISFFDSYLGPKGRAGFVMSSQASSAGHGEAEVRRKLIETGDVDVMISIRSNFFYTRTVPCELWFLDRGKSVRPSPPAPLPEREGGKKKHYRGGYEFSGLVELARELRQKETPAEEMFWQLVRDKRFLGLKFRRQHQMGDYILDFYCHEAGTAIELDGPVHETRIKKDAKRDAYLESQGIRVIRIKNEDFLGAPETILQQLAAKLPLPMGEGGGEGRFSDPINHKDHVLMIDARNIYRKVTRKIYDFSPEQLQNLTAIVWLYRGQSDRFLALVQEYLTRTITEAAAISKQAGAFREAYDALKAATVAFLKTLPKDSPLHDLIKERDDAAKACFQAVDKWTARIAKEWKKPCEKKLAVQKKMLMELDELAEACRDLVKDIDLVSKLAFRLVDTAEKDAGARDHDVWDARAIGRLEKDLDSKRKETVEQLKATAYFHRQAHWLLSRFPEAKLVSVPGLCRVVSRAEIQAADWSLTPGRFVGVAPPEVDEDFDFEQTLRDIHVELADLNREAAALAAKIQENFEGLGI
jgi:type I restriction-modification system DNA methylase subunit/very-short-patch-repair endonuclease